MDRALRRAMLHRPGFAGIRVIERRSARSTYLRPATANRSPRTADAEKNQIRGAGQFHDSESPGRSSENGRKSQRCRASVENAADRNPQRRGDAGAASLRDAAAEDVKRVRAGREIQQNPRRDEQSELVDAKHGRRNTKKLKRGLRFQLFSVSGFQHFIWAAIWKRSHRAEQRSTGRVIPGRFSGCC